MAKDLSKLIVESKGVDIAHATKIFMAHNGDYVILKSPIPRLISVLTDQVGVKKTTTNMLVWILPKTISNEEGTKEHPGNWDTQITWTLGPISM